MKMVKQTGYGIAAPSLSDMSLDEPEITRHGSRFGVRLKAVAPSIHMITYGACVFVLAWKVLL